MKSRDYKAAHFLWSVNDDGVATLTLNRPERKNPLTFESYAEMRDLFRALVHADDCKVVIVTGAGGNFSSGGDVHEIIGPLTTMSMPEMLEFTRMTGDLVKTMRNCPQPVIGAIDGICAGAGAMACRWCTCGEPGHTVRIHCNDLCNLPSATCAIANAFAYHPQATTPHMCTCCTCRGVIWERERESLLS